jgi:hypothetical protein
MNVKGRSAIDAEPCNVISLIFWYRHLAVVVFCKKSYNECFNHQYTGALPRASTRPFSKRHETGRADDIVCMEEESTWVEFAQGRHIIRDIFLPALFILMQRINTRDDSCSGLDLVLSVAGRKVEIVHGLLVE